MAGMTTRELLEKLYNQDYEKLKGKKLRIFPQPSHKISGQTSLYQPWLSPYCLFKD